MISLDTRNHEPIYIQIEKQIIKLIRLGVYEGNTALPSVRAMACELGVNPNTVARTYKSLEAQGIIYTIVGKGVFVSENNENQLKAMAVKQLKKALLEAKNSGIEGQEAINIVNTLWEEKSND